MIFNVIYISFPTGVSVTVQGMSKDSNNIIELHVTSLFKCVLICIRSGSIELYLGFKELQDIKMFWEAFENGKLRRTLEVESTDLKIDLLQYSRAFEHLASKQNPKARVTDLKGRRTSFTF